MKRRLDKGFRVRFAKQAQKISDFGVGSEEEGMEEGGGKEWKGGIERPLHCSHTHPKVLQYVPESLQALSASQSAPHLLPEA